MKMTGKKSNWIVVSVVLNVLLFLGLVFIWLNSAPKEIKLSGTEIFSIFLNVILFTWGVVQLIDTKKEEEKSLSKVRIWHKHIEGIKNALLQISQNPNSYSNKTDISAAVNGIAQSAVALDDSFAVERFYKDIEIKEKREANEKETQAMFKRIGKKPVTLPAASS
jgi:predicted permease